MLQRTPAPGRPPSGQLSHVFRLALHVEPDAVQRAADVRRVKVIARRRQVTRPRLAGGRDVEIGQVVAAEANAGDLRYRHRNPPLHRAVRVIADDLRAIPLGAPDMTLAIDGEAVRKALVSGHTDKDAAVGEP